jgi:hypothetical protein
VAIAIGSSRGKEQCKQIAVPKDSKMTWYVKILT